MQKALHMAATTTELSYIVVVDIVSPESRSQGVKASNHSQASRHQDKSQEGVKESRNQGGKASGHSLDKVGYIFI